MIIKTQLIKNIFFLFFGVLFAFFIVVLLFFSSAPVFATSYSVSGTLDPDATTANTGEPAGTYNGQNYWSWINDVGLWYFTYDDAFFWFIIQDYNDDGIGDIGDMDWGDYWLIVESVGTLPAGLYEPNERGGTGVATVAEYVAPNTAPNAPTLVSPANASNTNDTTPTLSANYSDPDSDAGATNYRIATSADNCTSGTTVASGASSATSDGDEDTTYTPTTSIGDDGTYYWCAQNDDGADGVDTSSWTSMGSFTLDTATPTISSVASSLGALSGSQTATITWTTNETSSTQIEYGLTTSYGNTTTETDTTTRVTPHTATLSLTPCQTYHIRAISKDAADNQATGDDFTVSTYCAAPGGAGNVSFAQTQTSQNNQQDQDQPQTPPESEPKTEAETEPQQPKDMTPQQIQTKIQEIREQLISLLTQVIQLLTEKIANMR